MKGQVMKEVMGKFSMLVKPNMRPPNPKMDRATEKKSALTLVSRWPKLRRPKMDRSSATAPQMLSVRKMERQPLASVCQPPRVGPMAGATLMARPTVPMAMPRLDNG